MSDKKPKPPSDFNDLHDTQGLPVVREQLLAALAAYKPNPPTPPEEAQAAPKSEGLEPKTEQKEQPFSSEMLLQRFALVIGVNKVWDTWLLMPFSKPAFVDLVSKELSKEWYANTTKKTISLENMKSAQAAAPSASVGVAGVDEMCERYTLIYGTKDVWDSRTRSRVPADTLKLAWPNEYDFWLKNPTKRKMVMPEQIVFDPTMRVGGECINTFDGFPLTPSDISDCFDKSYGIQLLLRSMCENEDAYYWLLRWLALPLQRPGTKLASAVLFHGEIQGAGKSLFFDVIHKKIYGKYGTTLGQHQLESQYSDWKSGMLYLIFEEIFGSKGRYQNMGLVKHQITGSTHRIEKKFVSGWEEANYGNAVFLSNEIQPLPIEPNDRRFLVCWPNKKLPDDILAAAKVCVDMPNNDGIRAWYAFLLSLPMTWTDSKGVQQTFHEHSTPPMTEAKERLIEYGLSAWEAFCREWQAGELKYPYCSCKSMDLFTAYKRYCFQRSETNLSATKFLTNMSVRQTKRKKKYYEDGLKTQGMVFLVNEDKKPEKEDEIAWLSRDIEKFSVSLVQNFNKPSKGDDL